ncbi:hypothetical protein EG68_05193 [Paragonimus skrjabini miyazakii]|uniref:Uncharacterized protein n=1 Tax=Paragonimus skrjabini miyazakii TaxID=59628 RepID=A0A8S9YVS8_9TREM|nr:hypothetical protein EG68_05193 [Paragonimus skrjabini miyazakii]
MGRAIRWKNTPAPPGQPYCPTTVEQVANCATHVPWIPISVYGLFRLYSKATTLVEVSTAIVYGLAIVCLFFTSSAFHVSSLLARHSFFLFNSRIRSFLHLCDRVVIYLFIASSYTPWLVLRNFHALWGWFTLSLVWLASVSGIVFQCLYHEQYRWLELLIYVVIGICPAGTLIYMHEWAGVHLLMLGGLTYVLGVVFFKLDGRVPMAHAIWHCFVFIGAYLHFCAVDGFLIVG